MKNLGWRSGRRALVAAMALAGLAACGSESSGAGGGAGAGTGATTTVACRQKAGADSDSDCAGFPQQPRKLDCEVDQTSAAVAAGCVLEKPGGSDVCCPLTVAGQVEASTLACTEPADTLTDSECAGTSHPRKLDCASAGDQSAGISAGCVPEHADDPTDFDLCCPMDVRGVH